MQKGKINKKKNNIVDITPTREVLFEKYNQDVAIFNILLNELNDCTTKRSGSCLLYFVKNNTIIFEADFDAIYFNKDITKKLREIDCGIITNCFMRADKFVYKIVVPILIKNKVKFELDEIIDLNDWNFDESYNKKAGIKKQK